MIRVSSEEVWCLSFCGDNTIKDHRVLHLANDEWPWSTEVSATVCYHDVFDLRISSYVACYALYASDISISLEFPMNNQISKYHWPFISHSEAFRDDKYMAICNMDGDVVASSSKHVRANGMEVKVKTVLIGDGEVEVENESDCVIQFLRYANGMPMLPSEGLTCSVTAGLVSFITDMGDQFGIASSSQITQPNQTDDEAPDISMLSLNLKCRIKCSRKWKSLYIVFSIKSHKIDFGTLSKSYIKDAAVSSHVKRGLYDAFMDMKKKAPFMFESQSDFELRMARTVYAPHLAASLSSILSNTCDDQIRDQVDDILGIRSGGLLPSSVDNNQARITSSRGDHLRNTILEFIMKRLRQNGKKRKRYEDIVPIQATGNDVVYPDTLSQSSSSDTEGSDEDLNKIEDRVEGDADMFSF
eukprot:GHVO01003970.1.p1 GENE.GHVO01003970.1~~GHVO01003970.1.p1  ORF type:complete len:414 (+),score=66.38 GHVO01003970.1:499-1740(+)